MKKAKEGEFRSAVYENRPDYADLDSENKFDAIIGIIATRLNQHPAAICSYSGGSDSDILIDLLEYTRKVCSIKTPVRYCFFNTGLELEATKRHVREISEKYNVEIVEYRPKKNIIQATREYGQPWMSKIVSAALDCIQRNNVPFTIADEFAVCRTDEERREKRQELRERYPHSEQAINFLCECNSAGEQRTGIQLSVGSSAFLLDFLSRIRRRSR